VTNYDVKVIDEPGTHIINYTFKSLTEVQYVNKMGLHVMRLCDNHVNLLPDFFLTALLFITDPFLEGPIGEKVPPELRDFAYKYHYEWLNKWEGIKLIERKPKAKIDADFLKRNAKSGDIICRFSGTGLSSLIMWGTGSQCSHLAMFMWGRGDESNTLFVLQSNGRGIWKQPVDHFWAENDGAALVMLPLDPIIRSTKFSTDKAWDFFDSVICVFQG
jgi:hypothetical protein